MIPRPSSPRPWRREPKVVTVYDAGGKPVSFVQNGEFLFAIEQLHDALVAQLAGMTAGFEFTATMIGMNAEEIAVHLAPARALLQLCALEPEHPPADRTKGFAQ